MYYLKKINFSFIIFIGVLHLSYAQSPSNDISANNNLRSYISNYINAYKDISMAEMIRTGVPAAITLAQGILESGYGKSQLTLTSNNHFGIKCRNDWNGETVYHDDDAPQECFRKYSSPEDSYKDHSEFLKKSSRYALLFNLDKDDYRNWAIGLRKAGYATDPLYAKRLINLIEAYNLNQYSLQVMNGEFDVKRYDSLLSIKEKQDSLNYSSTDSMTIVINKKSTIDSIGEISKKQEPINNAIENIKHASTDSSKKEIPPVYSNYAMNEIFVINNLKVICVDSGVALLPIAINENIDLSNLYSYNDLHYNPQNNDFTTKKGLLFLEKKKKANNENWYIAKGNETMYDIAQKTGVQLSALLHMNDLQCNDVPQANEKITLKDKLIERPKIH